MSTETFCTSMVCSGCACLCDDIDLVLEDGRLTRIQNVCRWGSARFTGRKKFAARQPRAPLLHARIQDQAGSSTSLSNATAEAADLISGARRIVVYGLCQMSQQAFDPLFSLAADRAALFIPSEGSLWTEYLRVFGKRPLPVTTLESVRNQADFVLFWGANPTHSCPRLVSRYALFARGRFTERGIEDRAAFAVDIQETEMARLSRMVVVAPESEGQLLQTLAESCTGSTAAGSEPPISNKLFRQLLEAIRTSRYSVIFCGRGPFYNPDRKRFMEALAQLALAMNRERPTFLLPLATDFNTVGFYQAFWQTGGFRRPNWTLLEDIRAWHPAEGDLLLAVSGDCLWSLSDRQRQALTAQQIPIISLSTYETMTSAAARVAIGVGMLGVDCAGWATRLDGVVLPLRPVFQGQRPTDQTVLEAIRK